jgi:hypothetical protein
MSSEDGGDGTTSSSLIRRRSRLRPGAVRGGRFGVAARRAGGAADTAGTIRGVFLTTRRRSALLTATRRRAASFGRRTRFATRLPAFRLADLTLARRTGFRARGAARVFAEAFFFDAFRAPLPERRRAAPFFFEARPAFRVAIVRYLQTLTSNR